MVTIPEIETPRLKLRGHRQDDFAACVAMWADPIVTRHIGGKPSTAPETWRRMLAFGGLWVLLGYGYWAVEEKATGTYVGSLGFAEFKRQIEPSIDGIPEAGWAFAAAAHGKGYATEAMQAAAAWGDRHLSSKRTVCIIDPENAASIRVAEKCGYREVARGTIEGKPTVVFERGLGAAV